MRDLPAQRYGDLSADPRRRAIVSLAVLALSAALIVAIMVFFVGTSGGKHNTGLPDAGLTTSTSPTVTPKATSAASSPTLVQRTTAVPKPISTANPCPSAKPCAVPGDQGGTGAALNKFRASHGLPAVSVVASLQAQQCALGQGDGPSCQPHYAWQPVGTQDGAQVISKIAARDGGRWLLDRAVASFSIGWAYTPGASGGPGQYGCAVLKGV
ncbi:MAG: hypothetical protein ABI808_07985 [Pseudonocardiales bacterium]